MRCYVVERKVWVRALSLLAIAAVAFGIYSWEGTGWETRQLGRWLAGTKLGSAIIQRAGQDRAGGTLPSEGAAGGMAPAEPAPGGAAGGAFSDSMGAGALPGGEAEAWEEAEPVWVRAPGETVVSLEAWLEEQQRREGADGAATAGPAAGADGAGGAGMAVADMAPPAEWPAPGDGAASVAGTGPGPYNPLHEAYRLERDRLQARRAEAIQRAMEDGELGEERRWESHRLMMALLESREKEAELEYLLRARGYYDAVVAVRDDYANVVVDGILDQQDAARIGELVARSAGVPMERIVIVDGYEGP